MSKVVKAFIPETDRSAQKGTDKKQKETKEWLEKNLKESQERSKQFLGGMMDARYQGANYASQMLANSVSPRLGQIREGNLLAQQMLAAGSGQYENAIMGRNVDRSFLQPRQPTDLVASGALDYLMNPQLQKPDVAAMLGGAAPAANVTGGGGKFYPEAEQVYGGTVGGGRMALPNRGLA